MNTIWEANISEFSDLKPKFNEAIDKREAWIRMKYIELKFLGVEKEMIGEYIFVYSVYPYIYLNIRELNYHLI